MTNEACQLLCGLAALLKRALLPLCIAVMLVSPSSGEEEDIDVTDKYVVEHKDQFRVETSVCEGGIIKFTFTQFAHEPRYWLGYLKIRKAGRTLVDCQLLPARTKLHVRFSFTVSQDVVSESEFVLYENGFGRALGADGKPLVLQIEVPQICGGTNYHFRLKDFVNSARQSNTNGSSKPSSSAQ